MFELALMCVLLGTGSDVWAVRIEPESVEWTPSPGWIPQPPKTHAWERTEDGARFVTDNRDEPAESPGRNHAMRWTGKLPAAFNMADAPYVSVRYRAKGEFARHGYVFWIGVDDGGKTRSTYPIQPAHVIADGRWHTFRQKLDEHGGARGMAVGIDALGPKAELEIDYVELAAEFPEFAIEEMLEFAPRENAWPAGREGFTPIPLPEAKADAAERRTALAIGAWFANPHTEAEGVPFAVPTELANVPASTTEGEESVSVPIGLEANELLLLLAANHPNAERFDSWRTKQPLRWLDEPERMVFEVAYADGTSDRMLPVHVAGRRYGVNCGLAVYALRPSPGKPIDRLVLHDRMQNAAFGIAAVTVNAAEPRFPEPVLPSVWYPPVEKPDRAPAEIQFAVRDGLAWEAIHSPVLGGKVELNGRPIFRLVAGEKELPSTLWKVTDVRRDDKQFHAVAEYRADDLVLQAELLATRTDMDEVELKLDVKNLGDAPVTGRLFFPCLDDVCIGSVADTWYFCGRTCGVMQREPGAWRDVIGEDHPLQVDGFFNPTIGGGFCLLPRDGLGLYRWYARGNVPGRLPRFDQGPETDARRARAVGHSRRRRADDLSQELGRPFHVPLCARVARAPH